MKKLLALLICMGISCSFAQTPLLHNTYNRKSTSLNGMWKYIVDPYENGYYDYRYRAFDEQSFVSPNAYFSHSKPKNKSDLLEYNFDASDSIAVPGDWNTQKENLFYYEGSLWYKKSFDYRLNKSSNRLFLYFSGANYQADVYLNGKKLGRHIGGFTPFNFDITELVRAEGNFVVVKIDNKRKKEGVPTLNTDWWNYGGITRDVKLVETPQTFIQDYLIQLDPNRADILKGFVQLEGKQRAGSKVRLSIEELGVEESFVTNDSGRIEFELKIKNPRLWSPKDPYRYEALLSTELESLKDQIGLRTIGTSGSDILLNGKPIFLKGICMHEESPFRPGRAFNKEDSELLLSWAKELGANYIRLAHYPHNEHMVRLADEMGVLLWEENPVYWTIQWENEDTYQNAEQQLTSLIQRDKNRAAVIIWSMANETPTSKARNQFLLRLLERCKSLDDTRLVSAALEQSSFQGKANVKTIEDPFASHVDVLSFNQYIGWYDGLPDKCEKIEWEITQNKPVLISEFGAGAKAGFHADSLTRWSEEYQAYLYRETLKMISKIDQLSGFSPWILVDFRSPRRPLPGIQDGWNRKGLISEQGEKKMAFEVLKEFYQKQ